MKVGVYEQEGYDLMGAAFAVYKEMGSGFLEDVYQECLELEFRQRSIPFVSKPKLEIAYKGATLRQTYQPDFLVFSEILVELKAAKSIATEHEAQIFNYLRALRKRVGYLLNFSAHPRLEWKRIIL